ncbi:hypothetical protein ACOMHN_028779 [Nucella lapillus]
MWRKGGGIVVGLKVVCLWFSLGTYTLLKHTPNERQWLKGGESGAVNFDKINGPDSEEDDGKFRPYSAIHGDSSLGWRRAGLHTGEDPLQVYACLLQGGEGGT